MRRYTRRVVASARESDVRDELVGDVLIGIRTRFDSTDEFLRCFRAHLLGGLPALA